MGTRNLTCVFYNGEYKVAQYGQWDGYPEGQGATCLKFLRDKVNWVLFTKRLDLLTYIDEELGEQLNKAFNCRNDGCGNACKLYGRWECLFPETNRDTGAEILELIQNDKLTTRRVVNNLDFAAQGDCEWCYIIDIDKNTFEVYQGWNEEPLTENDRFYSLGKPDKNYYPVKLVRTYSLDNLPADEQFLADFKEEDEDE